MLSIALGLVALSWICGTGAQESCPSITNVVLGSGSTSATIDYPASSAVYANYMSCQWRISSNRGRTVRVAFSYLSTESCCDFVEIFYGVGSTGQSVGSYSGSTVPGVVYGTQVTLEFDSDASVTGAGFIVSVDECSAMCASCSSSTVCNVCDPGSYLSGSSCIACADPNCDTCTGTGCTVCKNGYAAVAGACEEFLESLCSVPTTTHIDDDFSSFGAWTTGGNANSWTTTTRSGRTCAQVVGYESVPTTQQLISAPFDLIQGADAYLAISDLFDTEAPSAQCWDAAMFSVFDVAAGTHTRLFKDEMIFEDDGAEPFRGLENYIGSGQSHLYDEYGGSADPYLLCGTQSQWTMRIFDLRAFVGKQVQIYIHFVCDQVALSDYYAVSRVQLSQCVEECPPITVNAGVSATATTGSSGDLITFTCQPSYLYLSGGYSIQCMFGAWVGTQLQCRAEVVCPTLSDPAGGTVAPKAGVVEGNAAVYTCAEGLRASPAQTIFCSSAGWSAISVCEAFITCDPAPAPLGGSCTPASCVADEGESVTYSCEPDYTLAGATTTTCLAGNTWSNAAPLCNGGDYVCSPQIVPFTAEGSLEYTGTTSTAPSGQPEPPACLSMPGKKSWYKVFGTGKTITIDTCHPSRNFDTMLAVYTGPCTAPECVVFNDDYGGTLCSLVSIVDSVPMREYFVVVAGWASTSGNYGLNLNFAAQTPPSVTSLSQTNGPTAGVAVRVTISGNSFGTIDGSPNDISVDIEGTACLSPMWLSEQAVSCVFPALAAGTYDVSVTSGITGTGTLTDAFTYLDPPNPTSVSPSFGPANVGVALVISGANFGDATNDVEVYINGVRCTADAWEGPSSVSCTTPVGSVAGDTDVSVRVVSAVSGDGGLVTGIYTWKQPPAVVATSVSAAPKGGSTEVTVTGLRFGTGTAIVQMGGVDCLATTLVDAGEATCLTPPHAVGPVAVTIRTDQTGQSPDTFGLFRFNDLPQLDAQSLNAPEGGNTWVTITGSNFGDNDPKNTITITVGEVDCITSEVLSGSSVRCFTPPGTAGPAAAVVVETAFSGASAPAFIFAYLSAPSVSSVDPSEGPKAGLYRVTVHGGNFGVASTLTIKFGGVLCGSVVYIDTETASCIVPASGSGDSPVEVSSSTTGTMVAPRAGVFFFNDVPLVGGLSVTSGPLAGGTDFVVTGSRFGGSTNAVGVKINNKDMSCTYGGPTEITCTNTPVNSLGGYTVFVTTELSGTSLTGPTFTYVNPPVITSVLPVEGPASGGRTVIVAGSNFGSDAARAYRVEMGGVEMTSVRDSANQLTVTTALAQPVGVANVQVITDETGSSNTDKTYRFNAAPTISSVSVTAGSLDGGTQFTLYGNNFGDSPNSVTITIDGRACSVSSYIDSSSARCNTSPSGLSVGPKAVCITTDLTGTCASAQNLFSYNPRPSVSSIVGISEGPKGGGTVITIAGSGFGGVPTAYVGGVECTSTTPVTSVRVLCETPVGSVGYATVAVRTDLAGLSSDLASAFYYNDFPSITNVLPAEGPLGGRLVTLFGSNFGLDPTGNTVAITVGGTPCTAMGYIDDSRASCTVPAGTGTQAVVITTTHSGTGGGGSFQYNGPPSVLSVNPADGSQAGGDTVEVTGSGFGDNSNTVRIYFGAVLCASSTYTSSTTADCVTPNFATAGLVGVRIETDDTGNSGTLADVFTYLAAPGPVACDPPYATVAGNTPITIFGSSFSASGLAVTIDGTPATLVSFESSTEITCVTPPGSAGIATVTVSTSIDTGSRDIFEFIDYPHVDSLDVTEGPSSGDTRVVITGTNFGREATTLAITVGGLPCFNSTYIDDNTAVCGGTPEHTVPGLKVVEITSALTGSSSGGPQFLANDAPAVSSAWPAEGPLVGNKIITIVGSSFGTTSNPVTVKIDGTPCTSSTWLNSSSVECIGTPAKTVGAKVVTVETVQSGASDTSASPYEYVNAPTLIGVDNGEGRQDGWTVDIDSSGTNQFILSGVGFGSVPNDVKIYVAGVECVESLYLSSSTASCKAPPSPSGSGIKAVYIVTALSGTSAPSDLYRYNGAPSVTAVSPPYGKSAGGSSVEIRGTSFGSVPNEVLITIDGKVCGSPLWTSAGTATCAAPPGDSIGSKPVIITTLLSGESSPAPAYEYLTRPTVISIGPVSEGQVDGGHTLVITGTSFGPIANDVTVSIGGVPCTTSAYVNAGQATCLVPSLTFGDKTISITTELTGISSSDCVDCYTVLEAPAAVSILPAEGPRSGLTEVLISGTNFGSTINDVTVTIGGVPCTDALWTSSGTISCTTGVFPVAGVQDVAITTVLSGSSSPLTGVELYTYNDPPQTIVLSIYEGPQSGMQLVEVHGENFGDTTNDVIVSIAGLPCNPSVYRSPTHIDCTTPASTSGFGIKAVVVTTELTGSSASLNIYTYNKRPSITALDISEGPMAGQTDILVTGLSFGSLDNDVDIQINDVDCVISDWRSVNTAACRTPASLSDGTKAVTIRTDLSGLSSPVSLFTYNLPPTLTGMANDGALGGGTLLQLTGSNFGRINNAITVSIDGAPCSLPKWLSPSTAECVSALRATAAADLNVIISTALTGASDPEPLFTYNPIPDVTSILPVEGPNGGGTSLVIEGSFFGRSKSDVTVMIGTSPCADAEWTSPSTIECTTTASTATAAVGITVTTVKSGTSSTSVTFVYNAPPVIETLNVASGPVEGGTALVVTGQRFGTTSNPVSIYVGGTLCTGSVWAGSATMATCTTAESESSIGLKGVTITTELTGTSGPKFLFTYNAAPELVINAIEGPSSGATPITIRGIGFGLQDGVVDVEIDGRPCTAAKWLSNQEISCTTPVVGPTGAGTTVSVSLHTDLTGTATPKNIFQYNDPPDITGLSSITGPDSGFLPIVITGTYFGAYSSPVTVEFVGGSTMVCADPLWTSPTTVECVTPLLPPGAYDVRVSTGLHDTSNPGGATFTSVGSVLTSVVVEAVFKDGVILGQSGNNEFRMRTYDQFGVLRDDPVEDVLHVDIVSLPRFDAVRISPGVYQALYALSVTGFYDITISDDDAGVLYTNRTEVGSGALSTVVISDPVILGIVSPVAGHIVLTYRTLDQFGNERSVPSGDTPLWMEAGSNAGVAFNPTFIASATYTVELDYTIAGTTPLRICGVYDGSDSTSPACTDLWTTDIEILPDVPVRATLVPSSSSMRAGNITLDISFYDQYDNEATPTGVLAFYAVSTDAGDTVNGVVTGAGYSHVGLLLLTVTGEWTVVLLVDDVMLHNVTISVAAGPPVPELSTASGSGITEATAGVPATFFVNARDQFGNFQTGATTTDVDFQVALTWPGGYTEDDVASEAACSLCAVEPASGFSIITFQTLRAGASVGLNVETGGVGISGAPYTIVVHPGPTHPPSSTIFSDAIFAPVYAGDDVEYRLQARDEHGNQQGHGGEGPWTLVFNGPLSFVEYFNSTGVNATALVDRGDGSYSTSQVLTTAGEYQVTLSLLDVSAEATYTITVLPRAEIDLSQSVVSGATPAYISETPVTFSLQTRDRYGNNRTVGSDKLSLLWNYGASVTADALACNIIDWREDGVVIPGRYEISYNGTVAGDVTLSGGIGLEQLPAWPLLVDLRPGVTVPAVSTAELSPESFPNQTMTIQIHARDMYGNRQIIGGDSVTVTIKSTTGGTTKPVVTDNKDGSYTCSYVGSNLGGALTIEIMINAVPIKDSPFFVNAFTDCPVGQRYLDVYGPCENCALGFYANRRNLPACTECPANTVTRRPGQDIKECTCKEGFFSPGRAVGIPCGRCPVGGTCEGGTAAPRAVVGFFPAGGEGVFVECPQLEACLGGGRCKVGYEGYLCGKCSQNFYRSGNACVKCKQDSAYLVFIFMFVLFLFASVLTWFNCKDRSHNYFATAAIGFNSLQLLSLFENMDIEWPAATRAIFNIISKLNFNLEFVQPECTVENDNFYLFKHYGFMCLPLIVGAMLVIDYLIMRLHIIYINKNGAKYAEKHPERVSLPKRNTLGAIAKYHFFTLFSETSLTPPKARAVCLRTFFQLLVFLYLPITTQALSFIDCTKRDDGVWSVDAAPTFACFRGTWNTHAAPAIIFILMYCIGIPAAVFALLVIKRKRHEPIRFAIKYGYLTGRYQDQYFYWEVIVMIRKLLVICCVLFLNNGNRNSQFAASIVVLHISTVVQHFLGPFLSELHNKVEAISLSCITAMVFAGLVFLGKSRRTVLFDFCVVVLLLINLFSIGLAFILDMRRLIDSQKLAEAEFEDEGEASKVTQKQRINNSFIEAPAPAPANARLDSALTSQGSMGNSLRRLSGEFDSVDSSQFASQSNLLTGATQPPPAHHSSSALGGSSEYASVTVPPALHSTHSTGMHSTGMHSTGMHSTELGSLPPPPPVTLPPELDSN